ncbi:MAG: phenylalanine--tRNA ligase subunit beta [Deltaproteobacteria bacterium]|nr:MAG: phenylalanine--tRNA ligase subunit beta [Deltaproteobacteria bacterium]
MKVPRKWLLEYLDVAPTADELATLLTDGGLEVEEIERPAESLAHIVVGEILEVAPHPDAKKLSLCRVRIGPQETRSVVCGAPNVAPGVRAPLALPGATLQGEGERRPVERAVIRGVPSEGVLCSGAEIGCSEDHSGILHLSPEAEVGRPIAEVLGRDDEILVVSVTANRPDCLSIIGIAREVSALLPCQLRLPSIELSESGAPIETEASVAVEAHDLCPRYMGRLIRDVTIAPSPAWLTHRLEAAGIRPINNVVDATNYVLLEYGQPLHAFDFDTLAQGKIVVRRGREGETIRTLDGIERTLSSEHLLICDALRPVAIAGVMGGEETEVTQTTRNVFLESAIFDPVNIRRTSRAFDLPTEAAYRFERGVDPIGVATALDRVAALIQTLAGGRIAHGVLDVKREGITQLPTLSVRPARIAKLLGLEFSWEEISERLARLGIEEVEASTDSRTLRIPSYRRTDLCREADIAEEVARLIGFGQIPTTLPRIEVACHRETPERRRIRKIRSALEGSGLSEVITLSFAPPTLPDLLGLPPEDPRRRMVAIANPLTKDQSVLRTMIFPALLSILKFNLDRRNLDIGIYETGIVSFDRGEKLPEECPHVAGLLSGWLDPPFWRSGRETPLFLRLKGCVENMFDTLGLQPRFLPTSGIPYLHPGRAARIHIGEEEVGEIGELHPQLQARLDLSQPAALFECDLSHLPEASPECFDPIPRHPAVERDLAIIVPQEIPAGDILEAIYERRLPLLREVVLFDEYRGDPIPQEKKSLAFSLRYQAEDRSITGEEVASIHDAIVQFLAEEFGATLR